jgi:hypothetical protein
MSLDKPCHGINNLALFVRCDQSAVAMRAVARLAGVELAFLSRGGTTCGTSDNEYLLRGEFFFHSRGRILQALWRRRHASVQEIYDNDSGQRLGFS